MCGNICSNIDKRFITALVHLLRFQRISRIRALCNECMPVLTYEQPIPPAFNLVEGIWHGSARLHTPGCDFVTRSLRKDLCPTVMSSVIKSNQQMVKQGCPTRGTRAKCGTRQH